MQFKELRPSYETQESKRMDSTEVTVSSSLAKLLNQASTEPGRKKAESRFAPLP